MRSPSAGRAASANMGSSLAVRLGSLVILFVVVLGVPVLLLGIRAQPPWSLLTAMASHPISAMRSFGGPTSDLTTVNTAILVAWIAWMWLFVCLAAEIVGHARGRPTARLPVSRHVQALLAVLVSASIAVIPSARLHVTTRVAGIGGQQVQPAFLLAKDEIDPQSSPEDCVEPLGSPSDEKSSSSADQQIVSPFGTISYLVRSGDTMWSIAGNELGSPLRWREIAALNVGRVQRDGRTLTQAGWILPGWVLLLPASGADLKNAATKPLDPLPLSGDNGRNGSKEERAPRSGRASPATTDEHGSPTSGADPGPKGVSPGRTADETSLDVQRNPSPRWRTKHDSRNRRRPVRLFEGEPSKCSSRSLWLRIVRCRSSSDHQPLKTSSAASPADRTTHRTTRGRSDRS